MDPDKFRESRQEINRMYANVNILIDNKDLEASKEGYEEVSSKLEILTPQAEGEIQERSVKNLNIKINSLNTPIAKLKPKKSARRGSSANTPLIVWDEERVAQLSEAFLQKVSANMADTQDATVSFSTTGKGIRPSYQIDFGDKNKTAFSGSGHTPLKKLISSTANKVSEPFSQETIVSILNKK